jgi:hypothetical protein
MIDWRRRKPAPPVMVDISAEAKYCQLFKKNVGFELVKLAEGDTRFCNQLRPTRPPGHLSLCGRVAWYTTLRDGPDGCFLCPDCANEAILTGRIRAVGK